MTTDLDHAITTAVADIVAATPPVPPLYNEEAAPDPMWLTSTPDPLRHRASRLVVVAAAAVVLLGVGAIFLAGTGRHDPERAGQEVAHLPVPAITLPAEAPEPGSIVPALTEPPVAAGEPLPGERDSSARTGYWTALSLGRVNNSMVDQPITIAVFEGTWRVLDAAADVVRDGHEYRRATIGDFEILASRSTGADATVAAFGAVDTTLLNAVIDSVVTDTSQRPYAVYVDPPAGYSVVAPLRELGTDPTPRQTVVLNSGTVVVNEVSDWVDPLMYAASTGADLRREVVKGSEAWNGTVTSPTAGPLTFLVWAPEPYVVFEIVSSEPNVKLDQLIDIAEAVSAVDSP